MTLRIIAAVGIAGTAAGIAMQMAAKVHYPTVPPAFIIAAIAFALTLFGPWRWSPAAASVVGIFTIVGGIVAARWRDRLAGHGRTLAVAGTWVQMFAGVVALVAAIVALRVEYSRQ
ncbi:MAG TPA: hypothetical protein VHC49_11215 [Mycobacteriales bacterium]|nr:hypothetical protein [Mycobacteriales bacterium]